MIDFLRFFFALVIAVFHLQQRHPIFLWLNHGNIGVSFFFILSGWYMAKHAMQITHEGIHIGLETIHYIRSKLSIFYTPYFICWICSYVYYNVIEQNSLIMWIKNLFYNFDELLLIYMNGMNDSPYLIQCWYLSAMIIAIMMIYPVLLFMREEYIYIIAPLTTLLLYGFICYHEGGFRGVLAHYYFFNRGMLWALSTINLGVFCFGLGNLFLFDDEKYKARFIVNDKSNFVYK